MPFGTFSVLLNTGRVVQACLANMDTPLDNRDDLLIRVAVCKHVLSVIYQCYLFPSYLSKVLKPKSFSQLTPAS